MKKTQDKNWGHIIGGVLVGAIIGIGSTMFVFQERISRLEGLSIQAKKISENNNRNKPDNTPKPEITTKQKERYGSGRLEGILSDRNGNNLSDMVISIRNGPQTVTDIAGRFVLDRIQTGDQIIIVYPPSGKGVLTQNINISENRTTRTSIIYSSESSRLALLSITSPVDDGELEVIKEGSDYFSTIYGKSDGLSQIFFPKKFDVWLLIKSEKDSRLWVQRPSAIIDPVDNNWRGKIRLGDMKNQPTDGDNWTIVAVATPHDSEINRIINTPKMTLLPTHISSNVVSAKTRIKIGKRK